MKKFNGAMIVDDDDISTYITENLIIENGVTDFVYIAHNGEQALNILNEKCLEDISHCPDLILLDLNMPVMTGFEFLEQYTLLEQLKGKIKIFVLSSSSYLKDIEKARSFKDVTGYITKPLTQDKIEKMIGGKWPE